MEQLWEELKAAALEGDLSKVKSLLEAFDLIEDSKICTRSMKAKRAKLNLMTKQMQYTLLDIAVCNEHLDIIELFLNNNFTLEFQTSDEYDIEMLDRNVPLLHTAVDARNKSLVELLLKSGANVNEKTQNTRVSWSDSGCFVTGLKTTPLHIAAENNDKEIALELLKYGANIATVGCSKRNAMHFAASGGHLSMVKFLFDRDPLMVNCYSDFHQLPLHEAAKNGHGEVALFLLNYPYKNPDCVMKPVMAAACENGLIEIVEILLNRGFEVNTKISSYQKCTALLIAAYSNQDKVVKLLLDRGANVDEKTTSGDTALFFAVWYRSSKIAELLLQHGANIYEYHNGESILHVASTIYNAHQEDGILETLLFHQADPNAKDQDGRTPLQRALQIVLFNNALPLIKWTVKKYLDCTDVCAEHLSMISKDSNLMTYWNNCAEEMKIISGEMIYNTNVKFIDVMESQSSTQLASYARNQNIIDAVTSEALKSKFPIYGNVLQRTLEKGIVRRQLQDTARRVFCTLHDKNDQKLPQLPIIIIDHVISFLSNNDLINFTQ